MRVKTASVVVMVLLAAASISSGVSRLSLSDGGQQEIELIIEPTNISKSRETASCDPAIAIERGRKESAVIAVAWAEDQGKATPLRCPNPETEITGSNFEIILKRSTSQTDNTRTFDFPSDIKDGNISTTKDSTSLAPTLAASGDVLFVVWQDSSDPEASAVIPSGESVILLRRVISGASPPLSDVFRISNNPRGIRAIVPDIAVQVRRAPGPPESPKPFVTWAETDGFSSSIRFRSSTPFSPGIEIRGGISRFQRAGEILGGPAIGVDGSGRVTVAWTGAVGGVPEIETSQSETAGIDFFKPTFPLIFNISNTPNGISQQPDLAASTVGGRSIFWVAWSEGPADSSEIFVQPSDDITARPNLSAGIPNRKGGARNPAIAVFGNNIYVVFEQDVQPAGKPAHPAIFFNSSSDGGKTFKKIAKQISAEGKPARKPAIAVDEGGAIYVVWEQEEEETPGKKNTEIIFTSFISK